MEEADPMTPRWRAALLTLLLWATPVAADPRLEPPAAPAPPVQDRRQDPRAEERAALFAALRSAPKELKAREIEDRIWRFWMIGPNEAATETLSRAVQEMRYGDYESAEAVLDRLVGSDPDFAEAWNQRALLRFLTEDYAGSLLDIEKVLALEPKHFGALSGRGLILSRIGDRDGALAAIEAALAIHPFLKERYMIQQLKKKEIPL